MCPSARVANVPESHIARVTGPKVLREDGQGRNKPKLTKGPSDWAS